MQYRYESRTNASEYKKRLLVEVNELVKSEDWEKYPVQTIRSVLIALKAEIDTGAVIY